MAGFGFSIFRRLPSVTPDMIISPRSQWEEYICPCCDKLMNEPVQTSCGHQMCYECFDERRWSYGSWIPIRNDPWCPVRDNDGQEHKMSQDDWSKDRTAEWKINKLLVKCDKCEVECTVKDYRKFKCSTRHQDIKSLFISPRSQWEECICPCCDELMNDPVLTSCGHRMCYKCFDKWWSWSWGNPRCPVRDDDGQEHEMSWDDWSKDRTTECKINKLLVKCNKCKVKCTVKRFRNFNCSTAHDKGINSILISPRSQWEEYICPCCDELINDPVLTSCGHRMCYKCFYERRRRRWVGLWCPVRDDDGQEHKMSLDDWNKDRTAEGKINKLLVKCDKCEVECTVKRYRKFSCSNEHQGINSILISPRSQCEEYICPCCDELMNDPVQTSCGHRMCYKCFYKRRKNYRNTRCPVQDDDNDQEHELLWDYWYKDKAAEKEINKLLVKCNKCKEECSVEEYRKFHSISTTILSQEQNVGLCRFLVNDCKEDLPHWKQLLQQNAVITPSCDDTDNELFLSTSKCAFQHSLKQCSCPRCNYLLELLSAAADTEQESDCSTATAVYTKLTSMKTFEELDKLPLDQQQTLITQVLKEALPAAKDDLSINEISPLLYQSGVITGEEATELLGIFTGEEKITRLYNKMLPKKGLQGLEQYMRILYDTGWDTPGHMRHHGVLAINLSNKLELIKSSGTGAIFSHCESVEAAKEAIIPTVYSESLQDAVINLSMSINKLLLPMLKKRLVTTMEYFWLRQIFCPGEKIKELYEVFLPQKGVKGLKSFIEVLQDVGRKLPKYQNHRDLLKSTLQTQLSKV